MIPALAALQESNTVLITTHVHPDGDAIGSLTAMGMLLSQLGKKVTLYNETGVPDMYRFVPTSDVITTEIPDTAYDTVVLLDCASFDRVGAQADRILESPTLVNVDHHAMNSRFGISYIDSNASSTTELVYQIARKFRLPITTDFATAIYVGILTDTSSFRNSSTNLNSFLTSVSLVETGISPSRIAEKVYASYSMGRLQLIQAMLQRMELLEGDRLWISCLSQKDIGTYEIQKEDTLGLIEYGKGVESVDVAALLEEIKSHGYRISLRSNENFNVAEFAEQFGGGGHPRAAGFTTHLSYEEICDALVKWVRQTPIVDPKA